MPKRSPAALARSELERLWSRVYPHPGGCWLWWGSLDKDGYGWFFDRTGKSKKAHRVTYEKYNGPIPEGMTIDHLCRIKMCVNPEHMEVVTSAENVYRRAMAQSKCKRGHTYTMPYRQGHRRVCQPCVQFNKTQRLANV